jgi:hypothetical protein
LFEFGGARKAGLLVKFADASIEAFNHAVRLGMRRWSIWALAQAWSKT